MVAWYMRRRSVVATVALIATFALVGLPVPTGSRAISATRDLQPAAFTSVIIPADASALSAWGDFGDASEPDRRGDRGSALLGVRRRPRGARSRARR